MNSEIPISSFPKNSHSEIILSENSTESSEKPKNKETCDSCDFSCDTEEDLTCHRESSNHINTTRIFKCYSCNVNFGEDSLLQKHIETTHAESIHTDFDNVCYNCDKCEYKVGDPTLLETHIEAIHVGAINPFATTYVYVLFYWT